jgi:hypothetical protein
MYIHTYLVGTSSPGRAWQLGCLVSYVVEVKSGSRKKRKGDGRKFDRGGKTVIDFPLDSDRA